MAERFLCHNAGVIDQKFRREVIGSVNDEVIVCDQIHDIFTGHKLTVGFYRNVRVHRMDGLLGRFYFCLAHIRGTMDDLSL